MITVKRIIIDKLSGFGKVDSVLPGESEKVDELLKSVKPGTLIISAYIKPLLEWKKFLEENGINNTILITGKNKQILTNLMEGKNISPKYIVLATDTVSYGTSFDLYHTEILLDIPWSRGKLLQRMYRIIRRGTESMNKTIWLIGTKKKFEKVEKKISIASIIEHVVGEFYQGGW